MTHRQDDSAPVHEVHLATAAATENLGAALIDLVTPGAVIWLSGDLGAGKTTLTRGLLRALGHTGSVKSPTYTLLEPYVLSRISLYHFDFYRFTEAEEFLDAGLEEYFESDGTCWVEWADKARPYVRNPDVEIKLEHVPPGRRALLSAASEQGRQWLNRLSLPKAL